MEMKSIKIDKEIRNKMAQPIPAELIKQREGGGKKMLSYLSGSTVVDMLNDSFGYAWNWEVKRSWIENSIPYFNRYSKSREKITVNGVEGAWEEQGPVAHVHGTLTVFLQTDNGIVELKKDGFGSKSILGKQNDQESIFKAAGTDALKKAASLFGVGLALYRDEEEQAYFNSISFEDPWTDELKAQYADKLKVIEDYKENNGVSDVELNNYIEQVTGYPIVIPDTIDYIIECLTAATQ